MPTFSQGDVPVGNLAAAGLRVPSVTRAAKIATIEATDASRLGAVAPTVFRRVAQCLADQLGLVARP